MTVERAFYAAVTAFIKVAERLSADWMFIGALPDGRIGIVDLREFLRVA